MDNIRQNLLKDEKIIRWPKKVAAKNMILEYISIKIPPGKIFTEAEINEIIIRNIMFDDYVLVRRELIEKGFVNRTKDCKEYWRNTKNND